MITLFFPIFPPKVEDQKRKIKELLESKGLEGVPTLEKCKKLKIQRETDAEIAALDLNNIIDEKVKRGKRPRDERDL